MAGRAAEQAGRARSGTLGGEQDVPPGCPTSNPWTTATRTPVLWVIDAAIGETRRVSSEVRNVWEADWCGPGHAVAVTSDGAGEDAWYGAGVSLIDLATAQERQLASSDVQFGWVAASPSGDEWR